MFDKLTKILHLRGIKRKWNVFLINKIYAGVNPKHFSKKAKLLKEIGCSIGEGTKIVGPIHFYQPFSVGKRRFVNIFLEKILFQTTTINVYSLETLSDNHSHAWD